MSNRAETKRKRRKTKRRRTATVAEALPIWHTKQHAIVWFGPNGLPLSKGTVQKILSNRMKSEETLQTMAVYDGLPFGIWLHTMKACRCILHQVIVAGAPFTLWKSKFSSLKPRQKPVESTPSLIQRWPCFLFLIVGFDLFDLYWDLSSLFCFSWYFCVRYAEVNPQAPPQAKPRFSRLDVENAAWFSVEYGNSHAPAFGKIWRGYG